MTNAPSEEHLLLAKIEQKLFEASYDQSPPDIFYTYSKLAQILIENLDTITHALNEYGKLTSKYSEVNIEIEQ